MSTMNHRLDPKTRKAQILDAAVRVAERTGTDQLAFKDVANGASVSIGLVIHYFGTMTQLKRAVMREAVRTSVVPIVARGIAVGDPQALKASPPLRNAAAKYLSAQAKA
jgi:AcrR family transcriptional regulator